VARGGQLEAEAGFVTEHRDLTASWDLNMSAYKVCLLGAGRRAVLAALAPTVDIAQRGGFVKFYSVPVLRYRPTSQFRLQCWDTDCERPDTLGRKNPLTFGVARGCRAWAAT
jgi:hypothetical protein